VLTPATISVSSGLTVCGPREQLRPTRMTLTESSRQLGFHDLDAAAEAAGLAGRE